MGVCENCGKTIDDGKKLCAECVETRMKAGAEAVAEVAVKTAEEAEKSEKEQGKFSKLKKLIIRNGKDSVVNFLIRKVFFCLLSAILSAAIVFFTQSSFKEDFEDYYKNTFMPLSEEIKELAFDIDHFDDFMELGRTLDGMDEDGESQLATEILEASTLMEQATGIYKKAVSYSSSNKEITKLHNRLIDICEELQNITALVYTSMHMKVDYSVEYYAALQTLNSKSTIYKEMRDEMCQKHGIKIENGDIK